MSICPSDDAEFGQLSVTGFGSMVPSMNAVLIVSINRNGSRMRSITPCGMLLEPVG
jgi:hypothetical protein